MRSLSLYLCLMVFNVTPASAQEFFAELAAPVSVPPSILRFSASDEPAIKGDRDESRINQQKFFLSTPINKVPTDPASASWKWSQLNLPQGLLLPSGRQVPQQLYESEYGLSYKHSESSDEFWGASANVGSASDRPFTSKDNNTVSSTIFYSQSNDPTARWIWLLNYSNNRSFANEIPIPGFAYIYRPSKEFFGVFGFPFAVMRIQLSEKWSTQLFLGPYVYRFEFAYSLMGPFQAYAHLDSTLQNYILNNREKREDRLFITESKSLVGIKGPLSKIIYADLFAGLAYARSISESSNYNPDKRNHVLLENRFFIGSQISARF